MWLLFLISKTIATLKLGFKSFIELTAGVWELIVRKHFFVLWKLPTYEISNIWSKVDFHLSELTGQTIPTLMRISLLIKTLQPDQSNPKIVCTKEMVFQQKLLEKAYFHCQNDLSGNCLAGQFWLLETVHVTTVHATCYLVVRSKRFVSQGNSNIIHSLLTDLRV